jgi:hypothetical protein
MIAGKPISLVALLLLSFSTFAQTQITGRIAGTVKDPSGSLVVGATISVTSTATDDQRRVTTDGMGNFAVPLLPPGTYRVEIAADNFSTKVFNTVQVALTETTIVNAELAVPGVVSDPIMVRFAPLVQRDGPQLGRVVDARAVAGFPLATRNFTQILGLSPGTAVDLADNTAVGRNSQNISVNGARTTQNNYQINGVDANNIRNNNLQGLAVPAPESIQEFKVQTSLYDASVGRSGGGYIQAVTKSGGNAFHGSAYEYFRNQALNANNPFLEAVAMRRPVLERKVFGGVFGGRLKKNKAFFFFSYQRTSELNGASINSLSPNVLVAPGLTNDRSEASLRTIFNVPTVHPIALALLNVKLPGGQYLIPTPQANGRFSSSTLSSHEEDQFNLNVDYRISERNWLAAKFFFSNAPQTLALFGGANVAGFAAEQEPANRLLSIQDVQVFSVTVINEARIGYNTRRQTSFPQEPVKDSDIGISRANSDSFPGLPLIRIAPSAGGIVFGTAAILIDQRVASSSITLANMLSIDSGSHSTRVGGEVIYYQQDSTENLNVRGQIDFNSFKDFLIGNPQQSIFGTGISDRSLRTTDYGFFVQNDWRVSGRFTLNLGLRYELNPPFYDTLGRNLDFDPTLYRPRMQVGPNGLPLGPPSGGFVQAGNVSTEFDLPNVPNVGKRIIKSIDPNNFAPRIGYAFSPWESGRVVLRGGYAIFYSRISITHLSTAIQLPPNYIVGRQTNPLFVNPFFVAPAVESFPTFVPGIDLATLAFDRNLRTPYFHQYNTSIQYALGEDYLLEIAFVGGRGLNLLRNVGINQARLASAQRPVINEVLRGLNLPGSVITTNTAGNAQLRAPFQGASLSSTGAAVPGFGQTQSTGQSTYNSLQISVTKRFSKGLQFLGAYTYSKSIDNSSGGAIGAAGIDSGAIFGDQLDNRANRGVSNFDRTHRLVLSYLWDVPQLAFQRSATGRRILSNWTIAGIVTGMSGLPIDIIDSSAGSFYLGNNNGLSRPSWAPGATRATAMSDIPPGYFFNPFAFARPVVLPGQVIPSSNGDATAAAIGTDFGNVGRNVLRGPRQFNVDFSVIKRFPISESKNLEFRTEFFNFFNHVNFANPISNLNAVLSSGGRIDPNTGRIIDPGDFGRITSTSNNPRLIQLALKLNF